MGVTGLWKLLEPCGKPVPLESLEGKVVAVDISIWLNQAMKGYRDGQSGLLPNAHLIGVFHRICKLLTYNIKPVFVFDGGVPSLKRETLATRRLRQQSASKAADKSSQKLVQNLLRQEALRAVLGERAPLPLAVRSSDTADDAFHLPPAPPLSQMYSEDGSSSSESETDAIVDRLGHDVHSFDFDSAQFCGLAPQVKHDILSELKDTRKQSSWAKLDQMPKRPENFSDFQVERLLKRKKFQTSMQEVEAEITKRNTELLHMGIDLPAMVSSKQMASRSGTFLLVGQLKPEPVTVPPSANEPLDEPLDEVGLLEAADTAEYLAGADLFGGRGAGGGGSAARVDRELSALTRRPHLAAEREASPRPARTLNPDADAAQTFSEMGKKYSNLYLTFSAQWLQDEKMKVKSPSPQKKKTPVKNQAESHPKSRTHLPSASGKYEPNKNARKRVRFNEAPTFDDVNKGTSTIISGHSKSVRSQSFTKYNPSPASARSECGLHTTGFSDSLGPVHSRTTSLAAGGLQVTIDPSAGPLHDDPFSDVFSADAVAAQPDAEVLLMSSSDESDDDTVPATAADVRDCELTVSSSDVSPDGIELSGSVAAVSPGDRRSHESPEQPHSNPQPPHEQPQSAPQAHQSLSRVSQDAVAPQESAAAAAAAPDVDPLPKRHEGVAGTSSPPAVCQRSPPSVDASGESPSDDEEPRLASGILPPDGEEPRLASGISPSDGEEPILSDDDADDPASLPLSPPRPMPAVACPTSPTGELDPVWRELGATPDAAHHLWEDVADAELHAVARELADSQLALLEERGRQQRSAATVTDQMYAEVQSLLELFGIPYVVSPKEAEAQCALLEMVGLTQGTITDDSDIWLFGGQLVYKNFFNRNKFVEMYRAGDIHGSLGLDRGRLVCVALLTGSDYTLGVETVGCVRAMELLAEFPGAGLAGLAALRRWWDECRAGGDVVRPPIRRAAAALRLPHGFPSEAVWNAYLEPEVDTSREPFSWAAPDLDGLRRMACGKFGWAGDHTDTVLTPVMKRRRQPQGQLRLDAFLQPAYSQQASTETSRRLQRAVRRVRGDPGDLSPPPGTGHGSAVTADQLMDDGMDDILASVDLHGHDEPPDVCTSEEAPDSPHEWRAASTGSSASVERQRGGSVGVPPVASGGRRARGRSARGRRTGKPRAPTVGLAKKVASRPSRSAPSGLACANQSAAARAAVTDELPTSTEAADQSPAVDQPPTATMAADHSPAVDHPPTARAAPDESPAADRPLAAAAAELSELTPADRERVLLVRRLRDQASRVRAQMRMEETAGPAPAPARPSTRQVRARMLEVLLRHNPRMRLEREAQLRRRMGLPPVSAPHSCRDVAARRRATFEQALAGEAAEGAGPVASPPPTPAASGADTAEAPAEEAPAAVVSAAVAPAAVAPAAVVSAPPTARSEPAPGVGGSGESGSGGLCTLSGRSPAGAPSRLQPWTEDLPRPRPPPHAASAAEPVPQRQLAERRQAEARLRAAQLLRATRGRTAGARRRRRPGGGRSQPTAVPAATLSESSDCD